jgi:hypothetical protein
MAETITIAPSWATAAHIIAAALENGTEEGRRLARLELARMARMCEALSEIRPHLIDASRYPNLAQNEIQSALALIDEAAKE